LVRKPISNVLTAAVRAVTVISADCGMPAAARIDGLTARM
jgi:hypothetical protein